MNRKQLFFIITGIFFSLQLHAGVLDSLSLGFAGGYERFNTLKGEVYLQSNIKAFKKDAEIRLGLNNHAYRLTFDGVKDLNAHSICLFGDFAVYPFNFNRNLYTGLRWELINFNWLTGDSKDKIKLARSYDATSFYTGTSLYLQVGYRLKISNFFAAKMYLQPGWQSLKISNGSSSIGGYINSNSGNLIVDDQNKFACNINLSLEFRVK